MKRRGGGVSITSNLSTGTAVTTRISGCQKQAQHASFEFSFADMAHPGKERGVSAQGGGP
jgi:hypothetical protein